MARKQCPSCRIALDPEYLFCPECGTPVPAAEPEPVPAVPTPAPAVEPSTLEAARPTPAPAPAARAATRRFRLVRLARGGGNSAEYDVPEGGLVLGRSGGDIDFPDDEAVSPRHVSVRADGEHLVVEDLGSLNGLYVRIKGDHALVEGDSFVCGDSVFRVSLEASRFDATEYRLYAAPAEKPLLGTITRILADGRDGEVLPVRTVPCVIGREEGDFRFASDRFMSRRHAALQLSGGSLGLVDLKSRNGTYVRQRKALSLVEGDIILVGRQLLRIEAVAS